MTSRCKFKCRFPKLSHKHALHSLMLKTKWSLIAKWPKCAAESTSSSLLFKAFVVTILLLPRVSRKEWMPCSSI
jgi:hypothetical protein